MNSQSNNTNKILDRQYLNLLENVNFRPIFIMGEHRSGTTLLHKTLVATACFNFVKAYHVIKYDEILSNHLNKSEAETKQKIEELLKSLNIKTRGIDKVKVSSDLPTEYGFVLNNAGYNSKINQKNLSLFTELCKKIQYISDLDRPLLLKNPWDFPNFMYLKNAFPEARFIFIHRHPIHTINSKLKAIRSLVFTFNPYTALIFKNYKKIFQNPILGLFYRLLYSSYFDLGLNQITKGTVRSTTYFLENIELLPKTDYVSVSYEDLCKAPETNIHELPRVATLNTRFLTFRR